MWWSRNPMTQHILYMSSTISRFACPNNRTIPPHRKHRVAPTIHNESVWLWHFTLWKSVTLTIRHRTPTKNTHTYMLHSITFIFSYYFRYFHVCEASRSVLVLRRLLVTVNQQSLIKLGSWRVCRNGGSTI